MALVPVNNDIKSKVIDKYNDNFKIPLHCAPRKRKILDEEVYVKKLENIIERDFFPEMDNLQDKLDYLEAIESNDIEMLRQIQVKYSETPTPSLSNVLDSPATFDTPVSGPNKPVEKTPARDKNDCSDHPEIISASRSIKTSDKNLPSLDKFMSTYTSEDNDSFEQVLNEQNKLFRIKHPWLFEAEDKHNSNYTPNLALPSIEEQKQHKILALTGTSDKVKDTRPLSVENWKYKTFNSVMYVPEGAPYSDAQKLDQAKIKERQISYENTRYTENPFCETLSQATMLEASAIQAYQKEGKVGVDGKEMKETPKVNGYSYVRTPSPAPGVDCSPFMTWGHVEGTPFQLDGSQTPLIKSQGPSYMIPKVSARDELHLKLAEKVSQNHRDAKNAAKSKFASPLIKKTPGTNMERLSSMSPAAQKFFSSKLRINKPSDLALKASYTPSPLSKSTRTSSLITPKNMYRNSSKLRFRASSNTPKLKTVSTPSSDITFDLTDNLLQLPNRTAPSCSNSAKRKCAEDYF